jgi:hypothetical protein
MSGGARSWITRAKEFGEIKTAGDWARVLFDGNLL